ncbi:verprolin isoform X2 [Contarinia nasturtii]|nr:verprolin isoform X2 [Contarinia nasturtii]XP_031640174.1 verprolin isoform X2 [Contarinia nasturtii]XP_031640175.1 verprolin isoform X2 [Contarinia nasturtii]XP_031640176.1 verprolin isoform X2 [Contarinia nasturtii]
MAIPPPPPAPGPPPPPIGNLKLGAPAFGKSSGGADPRSALLLSIQKGAKLKKTTTVDKSGPLGVGRIADANNSTSSSNARTNSSGAPTRPPPPNGSSAQINGTPKLKGIFEGLSSMPKLKPVGGRTIGVTSPTNESPSSISTGSGSPQNSNGSAVDFSTELSQRIAMKKQMKSPSSNTISEINARNRGPPPQPPSKIVTDNNNSSTTVNSSPLIKQSNSGSPTSVSSNGSNISSILPNKSSLFGNSNSLNNTSTKTTTPPPPPPPITTATSTTTTITNKVVPNYGKPTCAPKPPVTAAKNGLSPLNNISNTTNNGNSSNRSIVSRAQSMRAPRSPPISVAGSTFPATQQFGTIRGIPTAFQSQESVSIRPAPTISRPTVAPPRPPIEAKLAAAATKEQSPRSVPPEKRSQGRCKSPPPPPIRSISNTNLPTLPLSIPPSAMSPNLSNISNSSTNNFGGSASNVSTLINNVMLTTNTGSANNLSVTKDRSPNTSMNSIAPPLPPHRTCPAPPPPIRQTSITPSNSGVAPPVPQRHSSMRNSNGGQVTTVVQHQTVATSVTSNSTRTVVNRFVIDLEAKFGHTFHNVTEFPAPQPFTKFEKSYPSRNMSKATTENRKAKAPSPPSIKTGNTATSTNEKYQLQLTQDDKHFTEESSYC